jgi:hypothetical protein
MELGFQADATKSCVVRRNGLHNADFAAVGEKRVLPGTESALSSATDVVPGLLHRRKARANCAGAAAKRSILGGVQDGSALAMGAVTTRSLTSCKLVVFPNSQRNG